MIEKLKHSVMLVKDRCQIVLDRPNIYLMTSFRQYRQFSIYKPSIQELPKYKIA